MASLFAHITHIGSEAALVEQLCWAGFCRNWANIANLTTHCRSDVCCTHTPSQWGSGGLCSRLSMYFLHYTLPRENNIRDGNTTGHGISSQGQRMMTAFSPGLQQKAQCGNSGADRKVLLRLLKVATRKLPIFQQFIDLFLVVVLFPMFCLEIKYDIENIFLLLPIFSLFFQVYFSSILATFKQ